MPKQRREARKKGETDPLGPLHLTCGFLAALNVDDDTVTCSLKVQAAVGVAALDAI